MPLPHTVTDFWRLVYDQHVSNIVMMNNVDDDDDDEVSVSYILNIISHIICILRITCLSLLWVLILPSTLILSCEEAIQPTYAASVVLLKCPLMPEIMHKGGTQGLPPPVKAGMSLYDFKSTGVTKTQQNKKHDFKFATV